MDDPRVKDELMKVMQTLGLGDILVENGLQMDDLMEIVEVVQDYLIASDDGN